MVRNVFIRFSSLSRRGVSGDAMGFLDFLKKENKAEKPPSPPKQEPEPPQAPPLSDELFDPGALAPPMSPAEEEKAVHEARPDEWEVKESPVQEHSDEDFAPPDQTLPTESPHADVPEPPEGMHDPQFEEATTTSHDEIPDFSDEDLQGFGHPEQEPTGFVEHAVPTPESEEKGEKQKEVPEKEPEQPEVPEPEAAEEAPQDVQPLKGYEAFGGKKPHKFLSSDQYFSVSDNIKGARKGLRTADAALLDAMSHHEEADEATREFAVEINDIQESLMELDNALFEG